MKVNPMDLGVCGVEQLLYAGKVNFDDTDVDKGIALCTLPANIIITRAVCVVGTAFNAATTNVLTVGTNSDVDDILAAADITEGSAGVYSKQTFVEHNAKKTVKAKYTQTGTAATAGEAEIYLFVVRIPD